VGKQGESKGGWAADEKPKLRACTPNVDNQGVGFSGGVFPYPGSSDEYGRVALKYDTKTGGFLSGGPGHVQDDRGQGVGPGVEIGEKKTLRGSVLDGQQLQADFSGGTIHSAGGSHRGGKAHAHNVFLRAQGCLVPGFSGPGGLGPLRGRGNIYITLSLVSVTPMFRWGKTRETFRTQGGSKPFFGGGLGGTKSAPHPMCYGVSPHFPGVEGGRA